jgi:ParB/RepB/Spo0J family partition protein
MTKQSTEESTEHAGTGSRTQRGLSGMNLTDLLRQGGEVPGVASSDADAQSLYQVREVPIEDILESKYQTREHMSPERFNRLVKSMRDEGPKDFKDFLPVRIHPTIAGKWQVVRGGHTRLAAAKEAGLTTYPIVIVEYDNKRSALSTARENLAREDLTPVEEGRLYLLLKEEFGYTQMSLADELGISRDRIKECEAVAKSAPYILDMIRRARELHGDSNHGLRAAKYLRRLDVLDERTQGLAARICGPLIDAFLYERITTDGIDIATKQLVAAADPEAVLAAILKGLRRGEESELPIEEEAAEQSESIHEAPVPDVQRSEKLGLATRRFRQFVTLIGGNAPSQEERTVLTNIRNEIDAILTR